MRKQNLQQAGVQPRKGNFEISDLANEHNFGAQLSHEIIDDYIDNDEDDENDEDSQDQQEDNYYRQERQDDDPDVENEEDYYDED